MVRLLADEATLINDTTSYDRGSASWGTIHDYGNITLTKAGIVAISFLTDPAAGGAAWRVKIGGSLYAFGCSNVDTVDETFSFMCYLAAGTYDVLVEHRGNVGIQTCYISNFQCGFACFSDLLGQALAAYSAGIAKTTTVRLTPLGNINKTVYCVTVYGFTTGEKTNLENPGDALTNGIQVLLDGVQQSWSERQQGNDANDLACGGKCYIAASAGVEHTITLGKDNVNTEVNISVAVCPWVLPYAAAELVAINVPQGSAAMVSVEPLAANNAKTVAVGKVRCVSFGSSTDFYGVTSATGIISFSYTFEVIAADASYLIASGLDGCIAAIGADVK